MDDAFEARAFDFNRDDERAQRVAGLALMLMNSSSPVPSPEIRAALYPDRTGDAFDRAFLRDRNALSELGLGIEQVEGGLTREGGWRLDPLATVETSGLTDDEALVVDLMCQPLCSDPTFPYGNELMLALAKVNNSFEDVLPDAQGIRLAKLPAPVSIMRAAFLRRIACDIDYSDAAGNVTTRRVATLGTFALREHLYFVTCPISEDGLDGSLIRNLRSDRVLTASLVKGLAYEIPEDFCVDDHIRLPFQMGTSLCQGAFLVPDALEGEVRTEVKAAGTITRKEGHLVLEADVADPRAAATWAIAAGVTPLSPTEVVEDFRSILEGVHDGR